MTIEIEKLTSGFYAVFVDGVWINASFISYDAAKAFADNYRKANDKKRK